MLFASFVTLGATLVLAGLLTGWGTAMASGGLGRGRGRGRGRRAEVDLLVGWGGVSALFTVLGSFTTLPFYAISLAVALIALAAVIWRWRAFDLTTTLRLGLLALPLLGVVSTLQPSQWDELTHWLLNARYLSSFQHFPTLGDPLLASAHANYPYGWPLVLYGINELTRLVGVDAAPVGGAAVFNGILLVVAARLLLSFLPTAPRPSWAVLGLLLLAVTILTPAFVHKIVFSAYADAPTEVVLFALLRLLLDILEGCEGREGHEGHEGREERGNFRQLGALLVLAVLLKVDNVVPIGGLMLATVLWQARGFWKPRNGTGMAVPGWRLIGGLVWASLPMIAVMIVWQDYTRAQIPNAQIPLPPLSQWRFDLLPAIARGFAATALIKAGYFIPMVGMAIYGTYRWVRPTPPTNDRLAALTWLVGITFVGYNAFLVIAYMTVFLPGEGERVASLLRYNSHLGLLETAGLAVIVNRSIKRGWWREHVPQGWLGRSVIPLIVLLAPVVGLPLLRFDQEPYMVSSRHIGQEIASLIPPEATLTIISLDSVGYDAVMIAYHVIIAKPVGFRPRPNAVLQGASDVQVADDIATSGPLWVSGWPPVVARLTGLSLDPAQSHLLKRTPSGLPSWQVLRDWPRTPDKQKWWHALHYWRLDSDGIAR